MPPEAAQSSHAGATRDTAYATHTSRGAHTLTTQTGPSGSASYAAGAGLPPGATPARGAGHRPAAASSTAGAALARRAASPWTADRSAPAGSEQQRRAR